MKRIRKIFGVLLALCLVVTQFPMGGRAARADAETKINITSSKLTFAYKKNSQDATYFKYSGAGVTGFHGDGDYEIADAGEYTSDGYTKLGDFESDTDYTMENVVLTINGKYEFLLQETGYTWDNNGVHSLGLGNIYHEPEKILYVSTDGKAILQYDADAELIVCNLAPEKIKNNVTSSKLSFTYEKKSEDASSFKFNSEEVTDFQGNGTYEIENAGEYTSDGYTKLGDFASDADYTLKNVVLTINGKYEFLLQETGYAWNDNGVYSLGLGNIYYQPENISHVSKDGKATLQYDADAKLVVLFAPETTSTPAPETTDTPAPETTSTPAPEGTKINITSSKLTFTYEKKDQDATYFKFNDTEVTGFHGNGDYEIENAGTYTADGYQKLGDFASDTDYTLKNVVLTINGEYEFLLKETGYAWNNNGVYSLDLGNIYYQPENILYVSKDGKVTLHYDADAKRVVCNLAPERTKTTITSSKLAFTYEKTGQDATYFKFSDTDVTGFHGNGSYEIKDAGTYTADGYQKLGDFASDTGYTLKNVVLTINEKYEFLLGDALYCWADSDIYKLDLGNIYYQPEKISYTSRDGAATLKYDGSLISLYVPKDNSGEQNPDGNATPKPEKPNRPYYPVIVPTAEPTIAPTAEPTTTPTAEPTTAPTAKPTTAPTAKPTTAPTAEPITTPTAKPTIAPTTEPSTSPTEAPSEPTAIPAAPTKAPAEKVQKGDKVAVSGQKYVVTNVSKKTVEYVATNNSKKKTVSIPATVKVSINGKKVTYKVTSIKNNAFKGNKKVEKVTVSKNIKTIGKDAFKNCTNLKTIVIKSTSLTKIGKNALKGTAKKLVIKVPAKKVSAYKKLFKNKGNNSIVIKKA